MEWLLGLLICGIMVGWVFNLWYLRTTTRAFDRQLNRALWPLWQAARQRESEEDNE